jgi:hypothetical protein
MKQFLLVYRRSAGEILALEDLGSIDPNAAMRRRFDLEMRERANSDVEVVLLSASSQEELVRTHARYFKTSEELTSDFAKAVARGAA